jgi:multicomponent Na+:H+ antiporter subunit B
VTAAWFLAMDAPDVAFTEAVVGAGVSTLIVLGALSLSPPRARRVTRFAAIAPAVLVVAAGGVLAWGAADLPAFGDPAAPAHEVTGRPYLAATPDDIGKPNVVTAVLASYRGYDTLGEAVVIFVGGLGVAMLLAFGERSTGDALLRGRRAAPPPRRPLVEHVVLTVAVRLMIPMILILAFSVQFHGDLSPGGGFQAGVLVATAVILNALVFGLPDAIEALPPRLVRSTAALGVLVYGGAGVASLLNGGALLDYDFIAPAGLAPAKLSQFTGILIIELGVLLTVSATMISIFYSFAGRARDLKEAGENRPIRADARWGA